MKYGLDVNKSFYLTKGTQQQMTSDLIGFITVILKFKTVFFV